MHTVVETPRYLADAERLFTARSRKPSSMSSQPIHIAAFSSQAVQVSESFALVLVVVASVAERA